jgi:hypothetical protein
MGESRNRVHFSYWLHGGVWNYRFIDTGLAVLGPVRRTRDPQTIRVIAERGNGLPNLEAKLMLEYGIKEGKGGLYLNLTPEQYAKIR